MVVWGGDGGGGVVLVVAVVAAAAAFGSLHCPQGHASLFLKDETCLQPVTSVVQSCSPET